MSSNGTLASDPAGAAQPLKRDAGFKLGFVEMGRGLAALAVVVFHANASAAEFGGPFWQWPRLMQHGVDFFFVLSGFIILHAHRRDIGNPQRVRQYFIKRAIRLLPLLWAVVLGWAALRLASGANVAGGALFRSIVPYPSLLPTIPVVVWTLRHELVFYGVFAVLLFSRRTGIAVFGSWLALIVAQFIAVATGHPVRGVPAFFVSGFALDFMFGMAAALFCERMAGRAAGPTPSGVPLLLGLAALAVALTTVAAFDLGRTGLSDYVSVGATFGTALLGLAFALVVVGLVRIEGRFTVPAFFSRLGAASYAVYLVHTVANAVFQRLAAHLPIGLKQLGIGHFVLVTLGVAVGFALHYWYERPVIDRLRAMFLPRPASGADRVVHDGSLSGAGAPRWTP